ncbi:MAG: hypothetical protein KBB32_09660 [Spirochaetia bacterium]|nr:hypothetical protein [Spirochaetia bacterium]
MNSWDYARITCIADTNVAAAVDGVLRDLALPEVHVQRAKQLCLEERSGLAGLRPRIQAAEDRADLYRALVPRERADGVMRRLSDAADLSLPGRGSVFSEDVVIRRPEPLAFDDERLSELASGANARSSAHTALCCIVQRGMAAPLAATVLDMGLCVPAVSYGEGMGLRNKLGLLRVTIPVEKEVMYCLVPARDADLVEGVLVHKARLDRPGQGFVYRYPVRAAAVNLRVSRGRRRHAATMEQVIAAMDELRGSSEWRRLAPARAGSASGGKQLGDLRCLSLVAEEGTVGDFVRAAMDAGAGGATLVPLERRSYTEGASDRFGHARETCDLIIPATLVDGILDTVAGRGLFGPEAQGFAELSAVEKAVTYVA